MIDTVFQALLCGRTADGGKAILVEQHEIDQVRAQAVAIKSGLRQIVIFAPPTP